MKGLNPCEEARTALELYDKDVQAGHEAGAAYWKGQAEAYSAVCVADMPSDSELLLHFGIDEVGSPGVILDEAVAKSSPCSCFQYEGRDLCWSKGIVGMLTEDQQKFYCIAGKTYKDRPGLTERYQKFASAAKEASRRIGNLPKGMPRLEAWLQAMSHELRQQGIEV